MACDEVIVLAGGRGTRLQSVVSDVPKPLAPVAGRPFLAWLLDMLARRGIHRAVIATGYLSETIEARIGARWQGMRIDYSIEREPLGTGGALKLAAEQLAGDSAHVLNGDTYLDYSPAALEATTRRVGANIGVALAHVEDVGRYGAVEVRDGRVAMFREKNGSGPGLINAGGYFLDAVALELLRCAPASFSFESQILVPQAEQGRVAAFADTADFIDIGVPADYACAQAAFAPSP